MFLLPLAVRTQMGSNEVLLELDVNFKYGMDAQIPSIVERLEKNIRAQFPDVKQIFIEARSFSEKNIVETRK